MPRRNDLKRILVIGAGPIVIGQACEFDYSGTQACKALRSEGLEVVLVNSNPATIMTDPELADRTYIEPLTVEALTRVIEKEKPDALLPTVGGQTALNLSVALAEAGVLDKFGVKLIGANIDAIKVGEDRLLFRDAMKDIGIEVPASGLARSVDEATTIVKQTRFPAIIRPSFTLGGVGGGIAYNVEELRDLVERGLEMSPVHEVLIEESVIGWKEFELEVMRDAADNFVVICSIENVDPMGVHTGDSITVAPALTLTDKEYQRMRDAARRIIRRVGVETGGSNIQFAVNPKDGRMLVLIVRDDRPKPENVEKMNDQQRIDLFRSMTAYGGTYTFDGKRVEHHIDISWNEVWTGTTVVREITKDGDKLVYTSPAAPFASDGKMSEVTLVWEKVK